MTLLEEINQVRRWRDGQIEAICKINSELYQRILITTCIDAFVQHQSSIYEEKKGKNRQNRDKFSAFLQKYVDDQPYSKWLSLICPTTLYYDYERDLGGESLRLMTGRIYFADDSDALSEANRLIMLLPEEKRIVAQKKHQYSALIYQMRNKLVHEMIYVGCQANFCTEDSDPIPQMVTQSKSDGNRLMPYKWTLHIPVSLLMHCLKSSTDNYLNECTQQGKNPLGEYSPEQKSIFAFYD